MKFAIKYELDRTGKTPEDVSRKGCGYDLQSADRFIEVKGTDHPTGGLVISLYKKLLSQLGKDITKYHIYLIYDMKREPKLKILTSEFIFANLEIDTKFVIRAKAYGQVEGNIIK